MKSGNTTRERILQQGLDLMSTVGFGGVTLGVLAERSGMSKSGLFAHFGSKEEVQLALLDAIGATAAETVIAPAMEVPAGLDRLKAVIVNWFGWSRKAGFSGGCPVAAGFFEFDDIDGPVRDRLILEDREWRRFLSQLIHEAMDRKELRSNLDVEQFVWELGGIYLGHHAADRFSRSTDADERAFRAFDRLLEDASPQKRVRLKSS